MLRLDYRLNLVTDRTLIGERALEDAVKEAILGGCTLIQLREKHADGLEFYNVGRSLKALTDQYQIPLIVNDRLDIALALDAAGLHIGQSDIPASVARRLLGPEKCLGVSASSLEEAIQAEADGADYLGVGALFPTTTKDKAGTLPLETLIAIRKAVKIPIVGIGGIHTGNISDLQGSGIDGIDVISAILGTKDIEASSRELRDLVQKHLHL